MRRIPFLAAALVAGLAIALPAVAQIAPRTDRYDPSVSAPIADGILGLIGMVLLVIAIILSALPIFATDWKRHAVVGWCIVLLMVFGGIAAFEGPPVTRDITLVIMWGLATIAAALTRLGGTLSTMLAIQASATRHDPITGKSLDASPTAPATTSSVDALQYRPRLD